ncbi:MAG: hypothetical protein V5A38_03210 [Halolamina sp.]|uniref:DUF7312 domain-containing protein n=1 Tax=Halolamina sp. TaxID=1940283 RepID=UPI002FC28858
MSDSATDGDEESEWQFNLDEVTEGGQQQPTPPPIERGDPSLEGAFFVLLGIALTLIVLFGV